MYKMYERYEMYEMYKMYEKGMRKYETGGSLSSGTQSLL